MECWNKQADIMHNIDLLQEYHYMEYINLDYQHR